MRIITSKSLRQKISITLLIASTLLSSCDYLPTSENKVKKAVAAQLIDSDSAKFDSLFKGKSECNYCGLVNGKNKMGGYSGLYPFIFEATSNTVLIISSPIKKRDFESYYYSLSSNSSHSSDDVDEYLKFKNGCDFPTKWEAICGVEFFEQPVELCKDFKKSPTEFIKALHKEFYRN